MQKWTVPKASLLPAALLALIVIFTFGSLQNYGPESTVRRFHTSLTNIQKSQLENRGIPANEWARLRSSLVEDVGATPGSGTDQYAKLLVERVYDQYRIGATYSLARMDRHPREVRIAVVYAPPGMPQSTIVWVVTKPSGSREWKINARKTFSAMGVP
ncbi:MAG TPA: hypothetical protein VK171_09865 [Fimbriimonas sp.]|nr:hypothetical protein [Fimbriimonas sp.]